MDSWMAGSWRQKCKDAGQGRTQLGSTRVLRSERDQSEQGKAVQKAGLVKPWSQPEETMKTQGRSKGLHAGSHPCPHGTSSRAPRSSGPIMSPNCSLKDSLWYQRSLHCTSS